MKKELIPEYWAPMMLEDICHFARIGGMNIYPKDIRGGLALSMGLMDDYISEGMRIVFEESMNK